MFHSQSVLQNIANPTQNKQENLPKVFSRNRTSRQEMEASGIKISSIGRNTKNGLLLEMGNVNRQYPKGFFSMS
jgi:hypothetical protein